MVKAVVATAAVKAVVMSRRAWDRVTWCAEREVGVWMVWWWVDGANATAVVARERNRQVDLILLGWCGVLVERGTVSRCINFVSCC